MQFIQSAQVFKDFPELKLIIPHGGGAVPYHWGRYRGIALDMKLGELNDLLMNNIYFDTCVYHLPGIELLLDVIPLKNILFGSEMVGAVRGIDPDTKHYFDDTKKYIDALKLPRGHAEATVRNQRLQRVSAPQSATRRAGEVRRIMATLDSTSFTPTPRSPRSSCRRDRSTRTATSSGPATSSRITPSVSTRRGDASKEDLFRLRDFLGLARAT